MSNIRKTIGCLHAHYSNIEYIENAFLDHDIEFMHFVDPGLIYKTSSDYSITESIAQIKVKEQLEWMAQCNVAAIIITCTNYISILEGLELNLSIPIIKIDEPFFESICKIEKPVIIAFSNPLTVEGTLSRLYNYASNINKSLDIEAFIINNSFELIMSGRKTAYNKKIFNSLDHLVTSTTKVVSVAQLSMCHSSNQLSAILDIDITTPLSSLVDFTINKLNFTN